MSIIKNENGTYNFGDIIITSSYDKETKLHTFTLVKNHCVPVQHIGSHLTLRNKMTSLVEELLSTEQIPAEPTAEVESDEVENFKELINKFDNATGEERIAIAGEMRLFYIRVKLSELFREFQNTTGEERAAVCEQMTDILKLQEIQDLLEPEEVQELQELQEMEAV